MSANNGRTVEVRMQTKDELIDALRDQCKFWRSMWSEAVDTNEALEKSLKEIKESLDKIEM